MSQQVHVTKDNLTDVEVVALDDGVLADGAARLAIESFSVTANNVTYAVVGDGFGYWNFFPAPDGKGIVPMWGHARVIESNCPELAAGERDSGAVHAFDEETSEDPVVHAVVVARVRSDGGGADRSDGSTWISNRTCAE